MSQLEQSRNPAPGPPPAPILIVEDDPFVLQMMVRIVESLGYNVAPATDGPQALDLLRGGGFGLVLLDRTLPSMSGVEVLRALKQDPSTAAIPVILVSGMVDDDSVAEGLEAGAEECLPKPFARELLRQRIEAHLERGGAGG